MPGAEGWSYDATTQTLTFGDLEDPESRVSQMREKEMGPGGRGYRLFERIGTEPNVVYLKKVDEHAREETHA